MVRGKKRLNAYLRRCRRAHVRAAGDHRRWWPCRFACGKCGAKYVRLYRDYGCFLRVTDLRCNGCLESTSFMVPLVHASDGTVWGYTSAPGADIDRWYSLRDAAPSPRWVDGEWVS